MADLDNTYTRAEAQRRADRVRQFQAELAEAERDGALELTPAQRSRLEAYHAALLERLARAFDVDVSDRQKQLSSGMQVVAIIGAIAFAASVVLFFYRFWNRMGTGTQVGVLVAAPLWAVVAAELTSRRPSLRFLTGLFALLAFACFILNLEQMGSIFALTPGPEALLAYAAFALGLAYAYGQNLLLIAGAGGLALYLAACAVRLTGAWWMPPGLFERPDAFLVAGAAIVGWSFVPHRVRDSFPGVLRGTGLVIACSAVLVLGQAGQVSWLPGSRAVVEATYQALSFLIPAWAITIGMRRSWSGTLALGGALFSVALFVKYVDWWWTWMPRYLFFLVVGATALLLLFLFRRARGRLRTS